MKRSIFHIAALAAVLNPFPVLDIGPLNYSGKGSKVRSIKSNTTKSSRQAKSRRKLQRKSRQINYRKAKQ